LAPFIGYVAGLSAGAVRPGAPPPHYTVSRPFLAQVRAFGGRLVCSRGKGSKFFTSASCPSGMIVGDRLASGWSGRILRCSSFHWHVVAEERSIRAGRLVPDGDDDCGGVWAAECRVV